MPSSPLSSSSRVFEDKETEGCHTKSKDHFSMLHNLMTPIVCHIPLYITKPAFKIFWLLHQRIKSMKSTKGLYFDDKLLFFQCNVGHVAFMINIGKVF